MNKKITIGKSIIVILCFLFSTFNADICFAQAEASSASFSYARAHGILASKNVNVEEYINFHRHNIVLPNEGESISTEIKWGNEFSGSDDKFAVLQIGFATGRVKDYTKVAPLNLSLVIDKSGSMAAEGRMTKLKIALNKFVEKLRPIDRISIVVYDTQASLVLPSNKIENMSLIKMAISGLMTGGSTNLNAGMVLGYEQVLKHFNEKGTNKVILLTDGLTNSGETNPEKIIENSVKYNKKNIDISTIGVGNNVNLDLIQQIAKGGKGQCHFIGLAEDIEKVFINEVEGLLSPIARNVSMEIKFDEGLEISHIYGYSPKFNTRSVSFELENMNSGRTQIVLAKFDVSKLKEFKKVKAKMIFKFYDIASGKNKIITKTAFLKYDDENNKINFLSDQDVKKNYTIAIMAQSLKDMAFAFESKKSHDARIIINSCTNKVKNYYLYPEDKDILRVYELVEKYSKLLNEYILSEK